MAQRPSTEDDDVLIGTQGDDELLGLGGNDLLHGGSGSDIIDGGSGEDTALFDGEAAAFQIQSQGPQLLVTEIATGQTDVVTNVEVLSFSDFIVPVVDIL